MLKIKRYEKEWYEIDINKTIIDGKDILECIEQEEDSSAGGSYCGECYYQYHTPSQGTILEDCALPDHVCFKCTADERGDGKNIIFRKIKQPSPGAMPKKRTDQLKKLLEWEKELPETTDLFNRQVAPTLFLREVDDKLWEIEKVEREDNKYRRNSITISHKTLIKLGLSILDAVKISEDRS